MYTNRSGCLCIVKIPLAFLQIYRHRGKVQFGMSTSQSNFAVVSEKIGDPRCNSLSFSPHRSPHSKPPVDRGQAVHLYMPSGRLAPFGPSREFCFQEPLDADAIPACENHRSKCPMHLQVQLSAYAHRLALISGAICFSIDKNISDMVSSPPRSQCSAPCHDSIP